jgi:hypothetical protein
MAPAQGQATRAPRQGADGPHRAGIRACPAWGLAPSRPGDWHLPGPKHPIPCADATGALGCGRIPGPCPPCPPSGRPVACAGSPARPAGILSPGRPLGSRVLPGRRAGIAWRPTVRPASGHGTARPALAVQRAPRSAVNAPTRWSAAGPPRGRSAAGTPQGAGQHRRWDAWRRVRSQAGSEAVSPFVR